MRRLGARAFGLVLLRALVARAQAVPPESAPRVDVTNCDESFASRLPAIVKLEIDVLLRERGEARAPPENIAVRCEAEKAHIEVTLDGASRASTIDLRALAAEHRARAVALAAAELVHAMAGRPRAPETAPSQAPTPVTARPPPDTRADASQRASSPRPALLVGGLAEWRGNPAALLLGGRMALEYPLGKVVTPELSVDASFGGISARSAHIAAQSFSGGAHVYFGTTTGDVRWDLGPGARFGWVHLAGQPEAGSGLQGQTLTAAWGGPEARARVAYGASRLRPALFALEVGTGFIVLPVRGLQDGTVPIYSVEGPWISVCAEVGLGF